MGVGTAAIRHLSTMVDMTPPFTIQSPSRGFIACGSDCRVFEFERGSSPTSCIYATDDEEAVCSAYATGFRCEVQNARVTDGDGIFRMLLGLGQ